MKLVGLMTTAVLSLTLVTGASIYAQEPRDQQEEQKAKPEEKAQPAARQEEKNTQQQDKNTKQEEKNSQQQDKNSKQEEKNAQQAKPVQQAQRSGGNGGGGIPRRPIQGQFWTGTLVSREPRRLQQSPLPIRRLFVRICRPVAQQLALHAGRFCGRD